MNKLIIFILLVISYSGFSSEGKIHLLVENIKKVKGTLKYSLSNSSKEFGSKKAVESSFKRDSVKVTGKKMKIILDGIPHGNYAVSVFHDENDNDNLDLDLLDVPIEGFGHSNNPKTQKRAPSFNEAKFQLRSNEKLIKVILRYL